MAVMRHEIQSNFKQMNENLEQMQNPEEKDDQSKNESSKE